MKLGLIQIKSALLIALNAPLDIILLKGQPLAQNVRLEHPQKLDQVLALNYVILDIIIIMGDAIFVRQEHIQLQIFQNVLIAEKENHQLVDLQNAKFVQQEPMPLLLDHPFVMNALLELILA